MEVGVTKEKVGDAPGGGFSEGFVRIGRMGAEPRGRERTEGGEMCETGWMGMKERSW